MSNIESMRSSLLQQIESSSLDEAQKFQLKKKIEESSPDELLQLLKQGQSHSASQSSALQALQGQCIFCEIINGSINSYAIGENESAIAVLEINPASEGHALVIPKSHGAIKEITENIRELMEIISKRIQEKLSPEKIEFSKQEIMNHTIINVIPIYQNMEGPPEKKPASPEELKLLQKALAEEKPIIIDEKRESIIIEDNKNERKASRKQSKAERKKESKAKSQPEEKPEEKSLSKEESKESSKKPAKREKAPSRIP